MLKLTRYDRDYNPPHLLYISAKHIAAMEQYEANTAIWTDSGMSYLVTETPEQIMAMPEMLYELHPPMLVTSGVTAGSESRVMTQNELNQILGR